MRLEGKGPVFRTERTGGKGRRFLMYKFRTLELAHQGDSVRGVRLTRVGAFLRRTSIEELPLLMNVLRGDMTLVGPPAE
ncbi:MAG: sugar transferase [Terriglobales bacterium]